MPQVRETKHGRELNTFITSMSEVRQVNSILCSLLQRRNISGFMYCLHWHLLSKARYLLWLREAHRAQSFPLNKIVEEVLLSCNSACMLRCLNSRISMCISIAGPMISNRHHFYCRWEWKFQSSIVTRPWLTISDLAVSMICSMIEVFKWFKFKKKPRWMFTPVILFQSLKWHCQDFSCPRLWATSG